MAKSFRDLQVWQRAVELTVEIYSLTSAFLTQERYGLTSQMCRAAVSIASNVAEGSARTSKRDFRHFVIMAKGSANELQTQLVIAQRLGCGDKSGLQDAEQECMEVGRLLHGLAQFLRDQMIIAKAQTASGMTS